MFEEDVRQYTHCAYCDAPLGDEFFMYGDNFLQVKFFSEQDGSDNAFCSTTCAAEALMLMSVENIKED